MRKPNNHKLFDRIDSVINDYADNKKLFCGGCCYAAYVIARQLSSNNIPYKVAVYQTGYATRCRTLKGVCKNEGCAHIAIVVNDNGVDRIIGRTDKIVKALNDILRSYGENWKIKFYENISWRELEEAYYNNEWNWAYDTSNNAKLFADIKSIF